MAWTSLPLRGLQEGATSQATFAWTTEPPLCVLLTSEGQQRMPKTGAHTACPHRIRRRSCHLGCLVPAAYLHAMDTTTTMNARTPSAIRTLGGRRIFILGATGPARLWACVPYAAIKALPTTSRKPACNLFYRLGSFTSATWLCTFGSPSLVYTHYYHAPHLSRCYKIPPCTHQATCYT